MTVLHTGSTKKFADGWDGIFGKGKSAPSKTKATASKKMAKKLASKKAPARAKKK
ncbi:MAG: hypothetical protein KF708_01660 [Pirellulales bacterium]|nr:hypothetical protein [Pirellulales bacterium]